MASEKRSRRTDRHSTPAYRRPGKRKLDGLGRIRRLALLLAGCLMLAAAFLLVDYLRQGAATRKLQAELREQVAQYTVPVSAAVPTPEPAVTSAPQLANAEAAPVESLAQQLPPAEPTAYPLPAMNAPVLQRFKGLLKQNSDLVGWLKADAISYVDFPIVRRDNSFYVHRDFYGNDNLAGTVFMDEDNSILPLDQNLILHGHNMKNGTMFGKLVRMMDRATLLSQPFFYFSSLYEEHQYVPYAVALTSVNPDSRDYFDFLRTRFDSQDELASYVGTLKARSVVQLPVEVNQSDRMLTLVTCHGGNPDERLIISLRALRPGENSSLLRDQLWRGGQR